MGSDLVYGKYVTIWSKGRKTYLEVRMRPYLSYKTRVVFVSLVCFFNRFQRESTLKYVDEYKFEKMIHRFRNVLGEEVGVVEEKLENSGDENGQTDHDGITVLLPPPGCQVDTVIVSMLGPFI